MTGFNEKPQIAVPDAGVNPGIYYVDPGLLRTFSRGISLDLGQDLFSHWVAENRRVLGIRAQGAFFTAKSKRLHRVTIILPLVIDATATIGCGAIIVGPYAVIGRDAYSGRSLPNFSEATIDEEGAVVGDHSWIGSGAHLESNRVVWSSTVLETMSATVPTIS